MNDKVELQPQGIYNVYAHLMRLAGITIINANSSQPILGNNDLAAFHAVLGTMH